MDTSKLRGKGAIVTGAGSGINLAFAKALYGYGCSVLIADLELHRTAQAWLLSIGSEQSEAKVVYHKTDVSKWHDLEAAFDAFAETFGGVPYIVCPGAGIYEPSYRGFWKDDDVEDHYQVLDVDLLHPIKMSRIAIRRMLRHNASGIICCVSSIAAQQPSVITPLYGVAKAGVNHFVRCMAKLHELAEIRIVCVAPGLIDTPLFSDHPEADRFVDRAKDVMIQPEVIADAMIRVSLDHKYPSGTILEVSGKEFQREVMLLNDPGPQGNATVISKKDMALVDVLASIQQDKKGALGND